MVCGALLEDTFHIPIFYFLLFEIKYEREYGKVVFLPALKAGTDVSLSGSEVEGEQDVSRLFNLYLSLPCPFLACQPKGHS